MLNLHIYIYKYTQYIKFLIHKKEILKFYNEIRYECILLIIHNTCTCARAYNMKIENKYFLNNVYS